MEKLKFFQIPGRSGFHGNATGDLARYEFPPFELDIPRHILLRGGAPVSIPPKCFELLSILIRNRGGLLTKVSLMSALWPDTFVEEANLSNLVALLRKILGESPARPRYIETVPKHGYRFAPPTDSPLEHTHAPLHFAQQALLRLIVFPFRVGLGFNDPDHLTYTIPDAISATLAELNALVVRSIQLAMRFDQERWDPKVVAQQAEVDFIVAGTLGKGRYGVTTQIQLIEAASGTLLWSRSWNVADDDWLTLHEGVVQLVIRTLLHIGAPIGSAPPRTGTNNPDSYRLYLNANQLTLKRTIENMAVARDLYLASLHKDPDFAPAWAHLGRCYRILEKFGGCAPYRKGLVEEAFQRAFSIAPDLIVAHKLYTPIQADSGQAENAMVRLLRRLAVSQNSPDLFAALVQVCRYCGLLDASLAAFRRARHLDPYVRTSVAHTWFALGDFERALLSYDTDAGLYLDALALACLDRKQESLALLTVRRSKFSAMPEALHSLDAFLRGNREQGVTALRQALDNESIDPEVRFYLARQAARLGELDLANDILFQSVQKGFWSHYTLLHDPWFAPVRNTGRFAEISEFVQTREAASQIAFLDAGGDEILRIKPQA
jgi:DNA-binding winged helix-turn-helix (wHTH) protein/tetratricopeptide (TPR) repeat protein